jgi:MipA family protein
MSNEFGRCRLAAGFLVAGLVLASPLAVLAAGSSSKTGASGNGVWTTRLGAVVKFAPKYEGGGRYQFGALPVIDVTWGNRVFLNMEHGLGIYALNDRTWKLGAAVGYDAGRDEKDGPRLRGMGDIGAAARASMFGSYNIDRFALSAKLARDIGGSDGVLATFGAGYKVPVSEKAGVSADISTTWADRSYMRDRFGVSRDQSIRSGNRQFTIGSGFKNVAVGLGSTYNLTENWSVMGRAGISMLMNDAADSPVVEDKASFISTLGASYRF